jgi:hypothetical protein
MKNIATILAILMLPSFIVLTSLTSCQNDPCEAIECQNGGSCNEGVCECPEGYEGAFCQNLNSQQHFGEYHTDYQGCIDTSPSHIINIEAANDSVAELRIVNLGDYECPNGELAILADLNGNSVSIAEQSINCGPITYTYSGSGTFTSAGQLSLSFMVSYSDGVNDITDQCTVLLERN